MTPPPGLPGSADNPDIYSAAVVGLYLQMPDTPFRPGANDHRVARSLFERGVPLDLVESALLLASLRRLVRPPGLPPLSRVRSLAYFLPVIDELIGNRLPDGYLDYLRVTLRAALQPTCRPDDQNNTLPDDR